MSLSADDIRRLLRLEPHPMEGGFFRETYRSPQRMRSAPGDERDAATAIYYLLTPETFSALHRLPGDEVFHFYLGDPVEMLQIWPAGNVRTVVIGSDITAGMQPQVMVPGGVWQGCRLRDGGRVALMGTTMSPGFDARDFELGKRAILISSYPDARDAILKLTRD
ncbi:MAG TPA: cupin domain-containing protein [Candidatus Krumholzibacteria bacterium]|nr:cupin domain-containing protein [Candidatus Krumholzibacteria bacterium]